MTSTTHYTAKVTIHRTTVVPEERDRYDKVTPGSRTVADVADFTLRAEDLESLKTRVGQHVELIEE